ncbi:hypothetical protein Taro_051413, partial [Colocasia esculenta]|nr:hypothetical protein [Colocasia esculenta]
LCSPRSPLKVKILIWRILHWRLPTKDRLRRFVADIQPICVLCGKEDKTLNHLFLGCSYSQGVWTEVGRKTCVDINQHRNIVNWRTHLKFPEEAKLSAEAKDVVCKLLCNVEQRLETKGAHEIKAHPWFRGVQWEKLYQMEAAFIPQVNDELDTQNFEKFEESETPMQTSSKSGPWRKMLSSKDVNFVGYTYKNFEIVNDHQVPGIDSTPPDPPVQGSFLNMLPTQLEVSESPEQSPPSND